MAAQYVVGGPFRNFIHRFMAPCQLTLRSTFHRDNLHPQIKLAQRTMRLSTPFNHNFSDMVTFQNSSSVQLDTKMSRNLNLIRECHQSARSTESTNQQTQEQSVSDKIVESEQTMHTEKFRSDYRPSPYHITNLHLNFELNKPGSPTLVTGTLHVELDSCQTQNWKDQVPPPLVLDGENLQLQKIYLDGCQLDESQYILNDDSLTIPSNMFSNNKFTIQTVVSIDPENNTQLSGLYASSSMFCTQCEPHGFRRITYYLDRPDIMAIYRVRIEADKKTHPILLSNGNKIEQGELPNARHYVIWEDPYLKPSYLFALVAGDLGCIKDSYTTMSGKEVTLQIFSEYANCNKLLHAMASLKKCMKWDEDVFGLEYDLDVFHIVAVNDFNAGAMENKGLNIFNSAYVLADPNTASDVDYERIEAIIAHEYFHNWTGNRVTCRDWFQLTLKEGLTVFRDQLFTADVGSAAVKRIEDIRVLRSVQFAEDAGPRAHPIRPESYISMDNFYTSTVYNKGAEIVRMYFTLLGRHNFRKGMDVYFSRHDGQAVTCNDFRLAMADANDIDFDQFSRWYSQAGTPSVTVTTKYDPTKKIYTLKLEQQNKRKDGSILPPLHIPIQIGLLLDDGTEVVPSTILELREQQQTFTFSDIQSPPIPSLLRGFSAPVQLQFIYSDQELAFLMAHDTDLFNRWEAAQILAERVIQMVMTCQATGEVVKIPHEFISSFKKLLLEKEMDQSLQAYALALPESNTLLNNLTMADPVALHDSREYVKCYLATELQHEFLDVYTELSKLTETEYDWEPKQIAQRRLKNTCLSYLSSLRNDMACKLAYQQFQSANCMTDSLAALICLSSLPDVTKRNTALTKFYEFADGDLLVIDKWFAVQAMSDLPNALELVRQLRHHDDFLLTYPNRVRSLAAFCGNTQHFHAVDGSGYAFLTDLILDVDKVNPNIAAQLTNQLTLWGRVDIKRQQMMKAELTRILKTENISSHTYEIAQSGVHVN